MNQATGQWAKQQKEGLKRQDEKEIENQARRVVEGGEEDQQSRAKAQTDQELADHQNERPKARKAEGTAASPDQPSFGGQQGGGKGGKGSQSRERQGMGS
jgi:hypothetical protein